MPKIYIGVSDGGDGSYSVQFFKSKADYELYKEREEQAYGHAADDNGGYEIDTDNLDSIRFSNPDDIDISEDVDDDEGGSIKDSNWYAPGDD